MNDDDFLNQFREPPSSEFADSLYRQLKDEEETRMMTLPRTIPQVSLNGSKPRHRTSWIRPRSLALAAALVLVIFSIALYGVYSNAPNLPMMAQIPTPSPLDNLQPITVDNVSQLREIERLGNGRINTIAWSPDGHTLAAAGGRGVWLFDATAPNNPPRLLPLDETFQVEYSSDGSSLAVSTTSGDIHLLDAKTGEEKTVLSNPYPEAAYVALAFSPDSHVIAAGYGDPYRRGRVPSSMRIWNIQTGQPAGKDFTGFLGNWFLVKFNPISNQVAVMAQSISQDDGTTTNQISVWNVDETHGLTTEQFSKELGAFSGTHALAFSHDGATVAIGTTAPSPTSNNTQIADSIARVLFLDAETGEERGTLFHNEPGDLSSWTTALDFSPTNQDVFLGTNNGSIVMLDSKNGSLQQEFASYLDSVWVDELSASPDAKWLAALTDDGKLHIWDVNTTMEVASIDRFDSSIEGLALRPGTNMLAAAPLKANIVLWNLENGERQDIPDSGNSFQGSPLAFTADGRVLAWSADDSNIGESKESLWDVESENLIGSLRESSGLLYAVVGNPADPNMLITGGPAIWLWNIQAGRAHLIDTSRNDPSDNVMRLAVSADGTFLASGEALGRVRLWNIPNQSLVATVTEGRYTYGQAGIEIQGTMDFSPNGHLLAYDDNNVVHVWNLMSQADIARLQQPQTDVSGVAFGSDSDLLVTAGGFRLNAWNVQSGLPLMQTPPSAIVSIAFSPDGRYIVTGGYDGLLRVWGVPGN